MLKYLFILQYLIRFAEFAVGDKVVVEKRAPHFY